MRQSGMLAAAGLLAMTEGYARLNADHKNAARLARLLENVDGLRVRPGWTQTNMVWLDFEHDIGCELAEYAASYVVTLSCRAKQCRLVTHLDVGYEDIETVAFVIQEFFQSAVAEQQLSQRPASCSRTY